MSINKQAIEYQQSISSQIVDFCKPLNDYLGISLFVYYKVYKDGSYISLSNDEKVTKRYISSINHDAIFFQNYLKNNSNKKIILVCLENPINQGMQLYHDNDYIYGLSIVTEENETYIEICCFIANKNNSQIKEFYIKHYQVLERFSKSFKETFSDKLIRAESYKAKYKNGFDFYLPEYQETSIYDIKAFLEAIGANSNLLNIDGQIIKLTKREMQCLELVDKGCSAKIIGRELLLSPKTIENHINNIRQKTGVYNRHDLVKLYRELFKT
jgi:DNA-binding CsgD family transcriptional regulator